ncbi:MAG: hypothetical protein M1539_05600 [Actinobacteria bacterium]|nr:hypothetical protein [Actinomycetota bacterium]
MRKWAILATVWLICTASLAFSAVAFGDGYGSGAGNHHGSRCEYEHGKLVCEH